MKQKRLIVNADDFGMSRGITDGILLAHEKGIVTSTSLMVNQPASQYAVKQLRRAPGLGVGIHLDLCQGSPLLPPDEVPSLVTPEGRFLPKEEMIRRLWRGKVSTGQIEAEFRAQIRKMEGLGLTPTHADSHYHLHVYPAAISAFSRALAAEGIRCARVLRNRHWPRNGMIGGSHVGSWYRRLLVTGYMRLAQFLAYRNLACPEYRVAQPPQWSDRLEKIEEGWRLAFEHIPSGTYELCCHPGLPDQSFPERPHMRERRGIELRILTSADFRSLAERCGIELITYRELC